MWRDGVGWEVREGEQCHSNGDWWLSGKLVASGTVDLLVRQIIVGISRFEWLMVKALGD
jgi:hypothetical protein